MVGTGTWDTVSNSQDYFFFHACLPMMCSTLVSTLESGCREWDRLNDECHLLVQDGPAHYQTA